MELILSLAVGLGLAAACGFRIFVPLLLAGIAHRTGHLVLADGFEWISTTPVLVGFGCATVLEVGAYYVPFLDNLLDALAVPSSVVAGSLVTASQVATMDPWLTWTVAVIGGGGAAGAVQGLTTVTRQISSVATAGFGNPLISTVEFFASALMTVLAVAAPLVAVAILFLLAAWAVKRFVFTGAAPVAAA